MEFDWIAALSPWTLLAGLCGAALGLFWGAIPGLTVNMALALMLGISFHWPVDITIVFLLATWIAGEFGGAIPAVVSNIPGTPAALPTQLAGHPLHLQGKGYRAIGLALLASVSGSVAGVIFLALSIPVLKLLVLQIKSWELALLALVGVAIAGNLSGSSSTLKGWIMGALGILISLIGIDPITGTERWTFGILELQSGIEFLPVLIGLFAVSEAFIVLSKPRPVFEYGSRLSISVPLSLLGKFKNTIFRSSIVGAVVGSIPGAGAGIASMLSYSVAQRQTGRQFDTGDYEGVIASEVANNANVGGSLVPTMMLGIPGSNASLLFMSALTLHGVVVGPTLETDHPGLVDFVLMSLMISNAFLLICAPVMIRASLWVLRVRIEYLMPAILVLAVCGTYAASNSLFDVLVLMIAGLVGIWFRAGGYPLAPLVLGFILGPIVDVNLRRALLIVDGDVVELIIRPTGLFIMLLGLGIIIFGMRQNKG